MQTRRKRRNIPLGTIMAASLRESIGIPNQASSKYTGFKDLTCRSSSFPTRERGEAKEYLISPIALLRKEFSSHTKWLHRK
jgi:hypothetical protein